MDGCHPWWRRRVRRRIVPKPTFGRFYDGACDFMTLVSNRRRDLTLSRDDDARGYVIAVFLKGTSSTVRFPFEFPASKAAFLDDIYTQIFACLDKTKQT